MRATLEVILAEVKVMEIVRYVYGCRTCEGEAVSTPIVTATGPKPVQVGSLASPSMVAYIMSQKYVESMPLYRQEQQLAQYGVKLSRQTLANWMLHGANALLSILYDRMKTHLLAEDIAHADETSFQVLREPGREAADQSYLWLYRTGPASPSIILYDYQPTRAAEHSQRFLSGFSGYLHVDGYGSYNKVSG